MSSPYSSIGLPPMYDTMRLMQIVETSTVVAVPNQISSSLGEEAVILELTQALYA